ncbi:MAG TPA: membrane protein insertase YidC [Gemmatimonadales bacterium]|nr:membrane protein insertase YidC [Gemmatimonadales bacterium]
MDRRIIAAVFLMMLVAVVPSLIFKAPPKAVTSQVADSAAVGQRDSGTVGRGAALPQRPSAPAPLRPSAPAPLRTAAPAHDDSVVVTSGLYRYAFSTRGARLISATLPKYPSMATTAAPGTPVELVRPGGGLLALTLVSGRDTVPLSDWTFTPSARSVAVPADGTAPLTFTASQGGVTVTLGFTFRSADYRFDVAGKVEGLGPTGGFLLVGLGGGLPNTEADTLANGRAHALVVKPVGKSTNLIPFSKIDPGTSREVPGPFRWVASKSEYFVVGLFATDTASPWTATRAVVPAGVGKYAGVAALEVSQPVAGPGTFGYQLYAGPMEYNRLSAIGQDFDDVNPYGIVGFRAVIRPFALFFRQVFVWMHTHLGISYGFAIILLGMLIRLVLWPLNQKAMRSAMAMQAIQPHMKALQERHKSDPARLQQEMVKLYKEHNANPLGGCLPMLIPMPILFALFFVFESTIEMRGVPFWWFTDLSQPDPHHIIPFLTGLSMLLLSWIGQRSIPPNPQAKMMMWMAPVMFTFFGFRFASGLNLYYVVSNLASVPQQWLLSEERRKRNPPAPPAPAPGGR